MDMAICMAVFNPAHSIRIVMNALHVKNLFELQGFPTFLIELVYEGRDPEIKDAIHVSTSSYMFHKENLFRVLETKIPSHYTKLAFLDADIVFSDSSWYSQTSTLLESFDVVQPFEQCIWLDLSYKKVLQTRKSALLQSGQIWDFDYHPGFAWCMRRDWYKNVGFYDYVLSGSGDIFSAAAWLQIDLPEALKIKPRLLQSDYKRFCEHPAPKITYLKDITIKHLFHGSFKQRKYDQRHLLLNRDGDIQDVIVQNEVGVLEWKEKDSWNPVFLEYFQERNDDHGTDLYPEKMPAWILQLQKKTS